MRRLGLLLACCAMVAGCAKVRAQSAQGDAFSRLGDKCSFTDKSGRVWNGHLADESDNVNFIMACRPDDGKPPRWVPGKSDPANPFIHATDHWECDRDYTLDGFKVEWPDGLAKISPLRCKANPQGETR